MDWVILVVYLAGVFVIGIISIMAWNDTSEKQQTALLSDQICLLVMCWPVFVSVILMYFVGIVPYKALRSIKPSYLELKEEIHKAKAREREKIEKEYEDAQEWLEKQDESESSKESSAIIILNDGNNIRVDWEKRTISHVKSFNQENADCYKAQQVAAKMAAEGVCP